MGAFHFMRTFSAQLGHLHMMFGLTSLIFRDCTVRVWRLSPGAPSLVKELSGHSELVHYVAIDQVLFPKVIFQTVFNLHIHVNFRKGSTVVISLVSSLSGPERKIKKKEAQGKRRMVRRQGDQRRKD